LCSVRSAATVVPRQTHRFKNGVGSKHARPSLVNHELKQLRSFISAGIYSDCHSVDLEVLRAALFSREFTLMTITVDIERQIQRFSPITFISSKYQLISLKII
jgi:hypothetical protein